MIELTIGSTTYSHDDIIACSISAGISILETPSVGSATVLMRNYDGSNYLYSTLSGQIGQSAILKDGSTVLFTGYVAEIVDVTQSTLQLVLEDVLGKQGEPPFPTVETSIFPNADPDDIGKLRNIIFGSVKRVPCRAIVAGALDTLTADITASQTSITVSGLTKIAFLSSGTIQIDEEKISYTSYSGGTFSGCTRGAGGTTAVAHRKGAKVFQVLSSYKYEVACHQCSSVSAVYVDGTKVTSGYTINTNDGGTTTITFSSKPIITKKVIQSASSSVSAEHGHSMPVTPYSTIRRIVTGYNTSGTVNNPTNAYDGNTTSYAAITSNSSLTLSFESLPDLGTMVRIDLYFDMYTSGGATVHGQSVNWPTRGTYRISVTGNESYWSSFSTGITCGSGQSANVFEVWADVIYQQSTTIDRTGSTSVSTTLSGNSAADVLVGERVEVDCTGYSMTAPDQVLGTLVSTYYGITQYSFPPISSYVWQGVIGDLGSDGLKVLGDLVLQCGMALYVDNAGNLRLTAFSGGTADLTITDDDLITQPRLNHRPAQVSHLRLLYSRDRANLVREGKLRVDDPEAAAQGYLASVSQGSGSPSRTIQCPMIDDSTSASNLVSVLYNYLSQQSRFVEFETRWIPDLTVGKRISYSSPVWGNGVYLIIGLSARFDGHGATMAIKGLKVS